MSPTDSDEEETVSLSRSIGTRAESRNACLVATSHGTQANQRREILLHVTFRQHDSNDMARRARQKRKGMTTAIVGAGTMELICGGLLGSGWWLSSRLMRADMDGNWKV